MKRILIMAISLVLLVCTFAIVANADLTTKQTNALINYAEQFIAQGNAANKLVYGGQDGYKGIQTRLINITSVSVGGVRYTYMGRHSGYSTFEAYQAGVENAADFVPGNYLSLGCAEFVSAIYKGALGFNFDYAISGHASAWTTKIYTTKEVTINGQTRSLLNVLDKNGKEIPLFDVITSTTSNASFFSNAEKSKWKPGDILVGVHPNQNNGLGVGHVVIYAGNDMIYESSSTPRWDGSKYRGELVHKTACISGIFANDYPIYQCLRIHDGVLDEDFEGYPMNIDFTKLSTESSYTDKKAPKITGLTVTSPNLETYSLKFTLTDSYGTERPVYLASDPTVLVRGTEQGESGILGIVMTTSATRPTTGWYNAQSTVYSTAGRAAGTYNIWVADEAYNYAKYTLTLTSLSNYVLKDEAGNTVAYKCNHTKGRTYHPAVEATALTDGNIAYYTCDNCGVIFATATSTEALELSDVIIPKLGYIIGDATGDGAISGLDVVRLKNYIANLDYQTGTSTVEIGPGADCTGDGNVSGLDVVRLKNYIANLDYQTGTSTVVLG